MYTNSRVKDSLLEIESANDIYSMNKLTTFPIEVFPKPISNFIQESAECMPCSVDYIALSVLVSLGAAIGNSAEISIDEDWSEPALLWGCIVGDPSTMKTPALSSATKPLEEIQKEKFAEYEKKLKMYEEEMREYQLLFNNKKVDEFIIPNVPSEPTFEQIIVRDTTMEALIQILEQNKRGVLSQHDEMTNYINQMDQYRSGKSDKGKWLSIYNRKPLTINRVSSKPKHINKPFVSVLGCLTPDNLDQIISKNQDGFADRFIFVYPKKVSTYYQEKIVNPKLKIEYHEITLKLFSLNNDIDNPISVRFSENSKTLWTFYHDQIVEYSESSNCPQRLESVLGKFRAILARITLILHLIRNISGETTKLEYVDEETIISANKVITYLIQNAMKVYKVTQLNKLETMIEMVKVLVAKKGSDYYVGNQKGKSIKINDLNRLKVFYPKFDTNRESIEQVLVEMMNQGMGAIFNVETKSKPSPHFFIYNDFLTD